MDELNREYLVKKYIKDDVLSNLTWLHLDRNKLKRINSNAFKGLVKLKTLSLYDNEIEEIEVGAFDDLSNLTELSLYRNKLKRIDRKCFEPLKSIKYIGLSKNDGLKANSFSIESISFVNFLLKKVTKEGFVSKFNTFLKQFPDLGNKNIF